MYYLFVFLLFILFIALGDFIGVQFFNHFLDLCLARRAKVYCYCSATVFDCSWGNKRNTLHKNEFLFLFLSFFRLCRMSLLCVCVHKTKNAKIYRCIHFIMRSSMAIIYTLCMIIMIIASDETKHFIPFRNSQRNNQISIKFVMFSTMDVYV